ncbi:MAG: hypothetical protein FD166_1246 [Bacteroidetes bacterium]|nr:MAG: hypothetical protein FD166_1246 [Bacteroidota bacterium]
MVSVSGQSPGLIRGLRFGVLDQLIVEGETAGKACRDSKPGQSPGLTHAELRLNTGRATAKLCGFLPAFRRQAFYFRL